nr:glutamine amidotransferase-like class 1 domain-containing protein 3A, mitochondrial isoform X1 [Camelus dromedarius]
MAALRSLLASRLAVTPLFALRPVLLPLPLSGLAATPRAALHASAPRPGTRVALVLSGCGVYDGTELHEASSILVHLSRGGAEVQIFAPDISQMHVIDHTKGQPSEGETRNVLTESARIARGKITDLAKLRAADHDAAIFPGGFGAAKNLSTFAVDGKDCRVDRDVERVLKEFHQAGKPIGWGPRADPSLPPQDWLLWRPHAGPHHGPSHSPRLDPCPWPGEVGRNHTRRPRRQVMATPLSDLLVRWPFPPASSGGSSSRSDLSVPGRCWSKWLQAWGRPWLGRPLSSTVVNRPSARWLAAFYQPTGKERGYQSDWGTETGGDGPHQGSASFMDPLSPLGALPGQPAGAPPASLSIPLGTEELVPREVGMEVASWDASWGQHLFMQASTREGPSARPLWWIQQHDRQDRC